MCSCHSVLEYYHLCSEVKLSITSFCFIYWIVLKLFRFLFFREAVDFMKICSLQFTELQESHIEV